MLINYQGGFIRRGLLGEIAFRVDSLISAQYFLLFIVVIAYAFVTIVLILLAIRTAVPIALMFLLSPTTLLFSWYDFEAFGRKDIFIIAAFALSILLVNMRNRFIVLIAIFIFYIIASFIVETASFYFPLAIALFCILRGSQENKKWHVSVWVSVVFVLVLHFLLLYGTDQSVTWDAISPQKLGVARSWQAIYPKAYDYQDGGPEALGGLMWIGSPMTDSWEMVTEHQSSPITFFGYLIGFLLSNIPLLLLLVTRRLLVSHWLAWLGGYASLAVMALTFAVGADWGRYIYLFVCHAFMFFVMITAPIEFTKSSGRKAVWNISLIGCLLLFYCTSWQLKHFVLTEPAHSCRVFSSRRLIIFQINSCLEILVRVI